MRTHLRLDLATDNIGIISRLTAGTEFEKTGKWVRHHPPSQDHFPIEFIGELKQRLGEHHNNHKKLL